MAPQTTTPKEEVTDHPDLSLIDSPAQPHRVRRTRLKGARPPSSHHRDKDLNRASAYSFKELSRLLSRPHTSVMDADECASGRRE